MAATHIVTASMCEYSSDGKNKDYVSYINKMVSNGDERR